MDIIFRKTKSIFSAVSVAKHEPRRYGDNGELLLTTDDIDDERLRSYSIASGMMPGGGKGGEKGGGDSPGEEKIEDIVH